MSVPVRSIAAVAADISAGTRLPATSASSSSRLLEAVVEGALGHVGLGADRPGGGGTETVAQ